MPDLGRNQMRVFRTGPWTVPLGEETSPDRVKRLEVENDRLQREVAELRLRNILLEELISRRH